MRFFFQKQKPKRIFYVVAGIIIGFVIGFLSSYSLLPTLPAGNKQVVCGRNNFAAGWEAARQKLAKSGVFSPVIGEVTSLKGEAKEVNYQGVVFIADSLNPLDDDKSRERKAKITPTTEIIIRRAKSQSEMVGFKADKEKEIKRLEAELAGLESGLGIKELERKIQDLQRDVNERKSNKKVRELQKKIYNAKMDLLNEPAYDEMEGKIVDLKPGVKIEVVAGNDISQKQEFLAQKIVVNEYLSSPDYQTYLRAAGSEIPPPPLPPLEFGEEVAPY